MKGDCDKAILDYSEAIKLDPSFVAAYNDRAVSWFKKGDYDKAVADFKEVMRLIPNSKSANQNLKNALEVKERRQP